MEALRDNRGKQKNHDEMSELEKLRAEVKILRAEKQRAEMEGIIYFLLIDTVLDF